jgi:aminoglycoside/choline kinase family phosphotransferase
MTEEPNASEGPSVEDEEFARQLGAVLRASRERPGSDFDDRVMEAVRAVHALTPVVPISRWRRERTLSLPPMAWGALAAGFAVIVSLGTLATAHLIRGTPAPAVATTAPAPVPQGAPAPIVRSVASTRRDTVYMVRFVLADAEAHTVSLVGDFNNWAKHATPLRAAKPGVWTAQVPLTPGRHEYAYVVDGKRWVADPSADNVADDFDTPSSVVTVGRDGMGGK